MFCTTCSYIHIYATVLTKPALFAPKLNSILLPHFTDILNIHPFPKYQVLNFHWSVFLKGILPTLQSHGWNNGTHGGRQLGSGDLDLLPLAMWPIGVSLATVWASCLLKEYHKGWFFHLPPHPSPSHSTPRPSHPPPLINTDSRKGEQKIL